MMSFIFTDVDIEEQTGEKGRVHGLGEQGSVARFWVQVQSGSIRVGSLELGRTRQKGTVLCICLVMFVSCSMWSDKALGSLPPQQGFLGEVITCFFGPE